MTGAAQTDRHGPPFRLVGSTQGVLSDAEMDKLIADHAPSVVEGALGTGGPNSTIRRSQIFFLRIEEQHEWLYQRIWATAVEFNRHFLGVDITGVEGNIQLARYDSSDQGFYDWHLDLSQIASSRKISITIQLSRPEDYAGGALELMCDAKSYVAEKARGTLVAFPSFVLHRVTPVTRGTRWSLVAWISGPRWR